MKRFLKVAYITLMIVIAVLLYPFFFPKHDKDETSFSTGDSNVSTSQYEPFKYAKYPKMIARALETLAKNGDEGSIEPTGVMILKRYENYLKEIQENNAYIGYDSKRVLTYGTTFMKRWIYWNGSYNTINSRVQSA